MAEVLETAFVTKTSPGVLPLSVSIKDEKLTPVRFRASDNRICAPAGLSLPIEHITF
jgi:hypothetical protein